MSEFFHTPTQMCNARAQRQDNFLLFVENIIKCKWMNQWEWAIQSFIFSTDNQHYIVTLLGFELCFIIIITIIRGSGNVCFQMFVSKLIVATNQWITVIFPQEAEALVRLWDFDQSTNLNWLLVVPRTNKPNTTD